MFVVTRTFSSGLLHLWRLGKAWKQLLSDFRDCLSIDELQSLIQGVRADNAASAGMHKDAAHARVSCLLTGLIEFRQVFLVVKD